MATIARQIDPTVAITSSASRRRIGRRILRIGIAVVLLGAAAPVSLLLRPLVSSNLGTVDPGRVIRAAQPTSQLPQLIKDHHLASILNLRGGSSKDTEIAAAEFEAALKNLHPLLDRDLPALHETLEAAGAPWAPGRKLPQWKR